MARKPREAKNIRQIVLQETMADPTDSASGATGANVKVTFEGPSETELNEWLASNQSRVEEIGGKIENIANQYGEKFEDLADDFGDDLED